MPPDDKPDDKPDDDKPTPKPDDKPDDGKPDTGDADKWKAMARKHETEARKAQKELDDIRNAGKSEIEKLTDRATKAEQDAARSGSLALRYEVAGEKGLSSSLAKRLHGSTREELEADADALLEEFGEKGNGDKPTPGGRPKEALRGGNKPDDEPDEKDPRKLAGNVPRRG